MKTGRKTITTNLYDLISDLHDEHGKNDKVIVVKIKKLAASGKISWVTRTISKVHPKN